jgi:uncharacterized membrane protein
VPIAIAIGATEDAASGRAGRPDGTADVSSNPPRARRRAPLRWAALAGLPLTTAAAAAVFYSAISIYRHDRFASDGYDLGIFDQTIWGYSRFEIVRNTVKGTPNLLGDHFHPALIALAPAYWIWNDARVLLVVQALLIAVASLPIFYWGRSRLGLAGAASVQIAFLAFWGVLAGVIFDFHELAVAVPAISFGLYALLERRPWLFCSMLVLGCLAKEDIALTFAAMGVYALVVQRRTRFGLAVSAASMTWFALVLGVIVPAISGRRYHYWNYPGLGPTWTKAAVTLVERPYRALTLAFNRSEQLVTLADTFGAWLFLPLLSPLLLVALPSLAGRFWAHNPAFWSTSFQYSLPVAPVLAFAAIDGASRVRSLSTPFAVGAAVCGVVLSGLVVRPLEGLPEFMSAGRAASTDACLDTIPPDAPVAASDRFVPHLTHRSDIKRLVKQVGERYLAVADNGPSGDKRVLALVRAGRAIAPAGVRYRLVCHRGDVTVLSATPRA